MIRRYTLLSILILLVLVLPVNANAPLVHRQTTITVTTPKAPVSLLNMTLLSATINGCSQTGNINATWTGTGFYTVSPSSFALIIKTKNASYGNTTDVITPNNTVQLWYLFKNVPITLQVSFISCTAISQEKLVYSDGSFLFILS